jgi:hypothetical protein
LFTPHNEHVILTTKLVSLSGFALNGYWDVPFLAVAAAFVRALEAALMFRLLSGGARREIKMVAWLACAAVFAAPVSGFNLLCGLQICSYFADLALIGSLFCVLRWSSAWKSGAVLFVMNLLGLFSMGSALAIPAATLATHLAGRRQRPGFWPAWSLTALSTAVYIAIISSLVPRGTAGATVGSQAVFFLKLFSWPFFDVTCGLILLVLTLVTIAWLVRTLQFQAAPFPAIAGLGVFGATNALLIALNRPSADSLHMHYWEMAAFLPLSVVVLGANVLRAMPRPRRWASVLVGAMVLGYGINFAVFLNQSWRYIAAAHDRRGEALAYYRDVFTSNHLSRESARIAAMLSTRDYSFLDDPILRFAPHPRVYQEILQAPMLTYALLSPEILPTGPPSMVSRLLRSLLGLGWCFSVTGAVMTVVGFASGRHFNGDLQESKT